MDKNNLKKDFLKVWKEKSFKLLIISTVLLIVGLIAFSNKPIFFAPIFALWIINFSYYEIIKKGQWSRKNIFQKLYTSYIFILNLLFLSLYVIFSFKLTLFSIIYLISSIALLFFISTVYIFMLLFAKRDSLIWTIILYLFFALITIVLFGYGFALITISGESLYQPLKENIAANAWDYIYFSSNNFYSMSFGDLIPTGWRMKLLSQVELILSSIIHVIILSHIISSRLDNKCQ